MKNIINFKIKTWFLKNRNGIFFLCIYNRRMFLQFVASWLTFFDSLIISFCKINKSGSLDCFKNILKNTLPASIIELLFFNTNIRWRHHSHTTRNFWAFEIDYLIDIMAATIALVAMQLEIKIFISLCKL